MQLLVAVKVFGGSLASFDQKKMFGSPACFEEIWPFADQEIWPFADQDSALLLVGKVLFLKTRFMSARRAAAIAQG